MSVPLPGGRFFTADECAMVAVFASAIRAASRRAGMDPPPPLLSQLLADVEDDAKQRKTESRSLAKEAATACAVGSWLTTEQARQRLKITTTQGVTDLIRRGRLEGRQDGSGCAWSVSERSVLAYLQERGRLEKGA